LNIEKLLALGIAVIFLTSTMILLYQTSHLTSKPQIVLPIKVACVGDSITEITSYTSHLQSMLGPNYTVGNFGVSGSTVSLNSSKPYMKQPQYTAAQNFDPDIVVIMLGTNDAHSYLQQYSANFVRDYTLLADSFENLSSTKQVIVVKSPPVYNNNLDLNPFFFAQSVIPSIEDVANQQNLPTVDVYDAFGNHSDYTVDGVHPNDEGATIIASQVADAINIDDYLNLSE
jgi:acyl-CoA thioesterase I